VIHNLTHYLLPDERQPKHHWIAQVIPFLGLIAVLVIVNSPLIEDCDLRYICASTIQSSTFFTNALQVVIFLSISYNLWWIFRTELRLNFQSFYLAVLIGSSAIGYAFLGTILNLTLPRFVATTLVLISLSFIGYAVTRHQALVEKRTTLHDYPISILTITCILGVYLLVTFQLGLSLNNVLMFSVLVIITHAAVDFVRNYLENLQRKQDYNIRSKLREMRRGFPKTRSIKRHLQKSLSIMCHNLEAQGGYIAVREGTKFVVVATINSLPINTSLSPKEVMSEEITQPMGFHVGHANWLVPAYSGGTQVASIGIGPRTGMKEYTEADLFWLEDIADQLGSLVNAFKQEIFKSPEESNGQLEEDEISSTQKVKTEELLSTLATRSDPKIEAIVEDGFRNIHDFSKLGSSPLVDLLGISGKSHIDCGKQVQQQLIKILEKLRPFGDKPPEPMTREWYCYTILHEAYLEDTPTRDIMSKLYISEGTYYRTRRKALRMISRELMEVGIIA
jgi:hypothetical protein